jgi:voltage-gated potassium channel
VKKDTPEIEVQPAGPMEIMILFLSVYVLIILFLEAVLDLPPDVQDIFNYMDTVICVIFLTDFFMRLYRAENKLDFMKLGWIDFISSIPMVGPLRYGRAIRVFRILRTLRGARSAKMIIDFALRHRAQSALASVITISITLLSWSSVAILSAERGNPDANITTAVDALWWSYVTMTTVGYGDYYPVTTEGRLIAAVLMMAGVGLFGTFTGFVTSWFIEDTEEDQTEALIAIQKELTFLRKQMEMHGVLPAVVIAED